MREGGIEESLDVQDVRNAVKAWPFIEVAVSIFRMDFFFRVIHK